MTKVAAPPGIRAAGPGIVLQKISGEQFADFSGWPLDMLAVYIEKEHHRYIKEQAPQLINQLQNISNKYKGHVKQFTRIKVLFEQCALDLSAHMQIEESIVFPLIRKAVREKGSKLSPADKDRISTHLFQAEHDHNHFAALFRKIRSYSHNYSAEIHNPGGCRETMLALQSFEEDLYFHLRLEQDVLFPGIQQLPGSI